VTAPFVSESACWVCGGTRLVPLRDAAVFELHEYRAQDPELAAYTGDRVGMLRCAACGFGQPAAVPALPRFFDRMYDQRWSGDWVERERTGEYKDAIFDDILRALGARVPAAHRRLLDIGAHAGRFLARARAGGWDAEGLELNPTTAAFAATSTGAIVHQGNLYTFDPAGHQYDALTMTDVLEHIPYPRRALRRARSLLADGGWIAVKVPNAPAQRIKERGRALVHRGYRPSLADNLVHVNQFSASSLRGALEQEGFTDVRIDVAAPELPPDDAANRLIRLALFRAARMLPAAVHSPAALHLQAYARRA